MSMIQIIITRFLSMHLKKLIQNVSLNVELNLMTKNIRKLIGQQMEYYDLLIAEINCTKN